MSRPIGTAEELERRRKQAVQAVADGEKRKTVAKVLGVHIKTVSRWVRDARTPGGLDARPHPGPTPGLTDADLDRLAGLLAEGAKAHGWHNELWTAARVGELIRRHWGTGFNHRYLSAWLRDRGLTPQRPVRVPRERNPAAIAAWVADDWPRIQKTPADGVPT